MQFTNDKCNVCGFKTFTVCADANGDLDDCHLLVCEDDEEIGNKSWADMIEICKVCLACDNIKILNHRLFKELNDRIKAVVANRLS